MARITGFRGILWGLTEINNGSGHYRPRVLTLRYAQRLLEAQGVDASQARLNDSLLRGTPPPDINLFAA